MNERAMVSRMDPKFHIGMKSLPAKRTSWPTVGDFVDSCHRGYGVYGPEQEALGDEGLPYVHSVDIAPFLLRDRHRPRVTEALVAKHPGALAHEGDIMVVRVGKGCAGRAAILLGLDDPVFVSDCVYILRTKNIDPCYLTVYLNTQTAQRYLYSVRRGVCSQFVTSPDLFGTPVFLPNSGTMQHLAETAREIVSSVPLAQQIAGVEKLETLSKELDTLMALER